MASRSWFGATQPRARGRPHARTRRRARPSAPAAPRSGLRPARQASSWPAAARAARRARPRAPRPVPTRVLLLRGRLERCLELRSQLGQIVSSACARSSAALRWPSSSCSSALESSLPRPRISSSSASSAAPVRAPRRRRRRQRATPRARRRPCAALGLLGEMPLQLRDPRGGLLLRPLELVAVRRGGLQLALERADALLHLGVDPGFVRLGGVAQPRLQLVEALGERVPLGQDPVEFDSSSWIRASATAGPRGPAAAPLPAPARAPPRDGSARARARERLGLRRDRCGRSAVRRERSGGAGGERALHPAALGPGRQGEDRSRAAPAQGPAAAAAQGRPASAASAAAPRCGSARGRPSRAARRSSRTRCGGGHRAARQGRWRPRRERRSRGRRAPSPAACRCGSAPRGRPEAGLPSGSPRRP